MRRVLVSAIVVVSLVTSGSPALADSTANGHNCAGSFSSSVTPEFVAGGAFGADVASQAQAGTRDDGIQALVDAFANCGAAH